MPPPQRLARINVDVRFNEGLDTRTHQKLVMRGKWLTLQNETLTADGTPKRRDPWITAGAFGSAINGLALYNSELLCVSGQSLTSFANATFNSRQGLYANVGVSKMELRRATGLQDSADMATDGTRTCYVWMDYDGTHTQIGAKCSVFDEVTGARILDNAVLRSSAGVMSPRVVRVVGAFLIFYIDGTSLYCRVIQDGALSTLGAETALVTNASLVATNFDACRLGSLGSAAVVAYGWSDATTSIRAISVTQTAGVPSIANGPTNCITNAHLPFANITAICTAAYDSTHIGVFALGGTNTGLWEAVLNASMAVTAGDTRINLATAAHAGQVHLTAVAINNGVSNQLRVFWDEAGSWGTVDFRPIRTQDVNNDTSTSFGPNTLTNSACFSGAITTGAGPQGPFIAGKAFANGNQVYLPVVVTENYIGITAVNNNQQNSLFVLDGGQGGASPTLGTAAILAKALYGTWGIPSITNNPPLVTTPCATPVISTGIFGLATTERSIISFSSGFNLSPTGLCRLTFTPNAGNSPIACQVGQQTFLAGGALSSYDGSGVFDHGFALFPEGIEATRVAGGGAMTAGTHQFCALYEWIDTAGQRHQSAPSPAMSVSTFVLNDSATVKVPTLLLTNKTGVNVVIYMTLANGLVFYRVTPLSAPLPNSQAASTVTATITSSDSQISGNELLYSQPNTGGTTLPNNSPPPCSTVWTHQNRVWMDAADDPYSYRFSQIAVQWVGLQFNETLGGRLPIESGGLVVGVSMDDNNILLCAQRIYRIVGIGPNADGSSNGYSQPIEIPTECGCSDARSVVLLPIGIIFKSPKGWHLLGRDLAVSYIGEGVEAFNGNSVSGAVLLKDRKEVRFSSSTGTTLVYSYHYKQWSTFTNYAALASIWWPTTAVYYHATSGGTLNGDNPGGANALDGGSSVIVTTKQTSWIRLKDLNGFQRVFRAFFTGTYLPGGPGGADSQLVINVDFDDGLGGVTLGSYSITIPSTAAISRGAGTAFDFRHVMQKRKCKSVAFQFIDTPTLGGSFGTALQGLTLELGFLRGTLRLPAAQST